MAQRLKGTMAKRLKSAMAQRLKGTMAQWYYSAMPHKLMGNTFFTFSDVVFFYRCAFEPLRRCAIMMFDY